MKNMKTIVAGTIFAATLAASCTAMADNEIKIWVSDATTEFTKAKVEAFLQENYPDYTVLVEAVGEGDAAQTDLLVTWLYKMTVNDTNYKMAAVIGIMVFLVTAVISLVVYGMLPSVKGEEDYQ